jgi:hypothetical protein
MPSSGIESDITSTSFPRSKCQLIIQNCGRTHILETQNAPLVQILREIHYAPLSVIEFQLDSVATLVYGSNDFMDHDYSPFRAEGRSSAVAYYSWPLPNFSSTHLSVAMPILPQDPAPEAEFTVKHPREPI